MFLSLRLCLTECLSLHEYLLYFTTLHCEDIHNNVKYHDNSDKTVCRNSSMACSADVDFLCVYYTGKRSSQVNIDADSNDIPGHPHDDKPRPYLCTECCKRFTTKGHLKVHKQIHTTGKLYSCSQCEKCFTTERYLTLHLNVHS